MMLKIFRDICWNFCMTRCTMMEETAGFSLVMFCFMSSVVLCRFSCTLLLRKKSQALRSRDLAGYSVIPSSWDHASSSSSSSYCPSVANAPNVLQPYWLIVLPLDVPDLTTSLLLWGPSGQRWRCLWTFLFSNVPTFATSRLQEIVAAKGGITWARNGRWILPENARLPRNIQRSFTSRKSTTWDRRLYFPSEGRRAEDNFALKNPTRELGYQRPARYL